MTKVCSAVGCFLTRFSAALTAFRGSSPRRVPGLGAGCAVPRCRGGAEAHWLPPAARGFPAGLRGSGLLLVLHRCPQRSLVLLPRGQPLRLRPEWERREDGQRLEVSACGSLSAAGWRCPRPPLPPRELLPYTCDKEGKGHLSLCICHRTGASALTTPQVRHRVVPPTLGAASQETMSSSFLGGPCFIHQHQRGPKLTSGIIPLNKSKIYF